MKQSIIFNSSHWFKHWQYWLKISDRKWRIRFLLNRKPYLKVLKESLFQMSRICYSFSLCLTALLAVSACLRTVIKRPRATGRVRASREGMRRDCGSLLLLLVTSDRSHDHRFVTLPFIEKVSMGSKKTSLNRFDRRVPSDFFFLEHETVWP